MAILTNFKSPTVAVIGSAWGLDKSIPLAQSLGEALARNDFVVVTGAVTGLPLQVAISAKEHGATVINVSPHFGPVSAFHSHQELACERPPNIFDSVVYTCQGIKSRNEILVTSVRAVAVVGGGDGTKDEFLTAYQLNKPIGVVKGSGGTSDEISKLVRGSDGNVFVSKNPASLARLLRERVDAAADPALTSPFR
jgi:uncharacterized protein (TIGR00725 family)